MREARLRALGQAPSAAPLTVASPAVAEALVALQLTTPTLQAAAAAPASPDGLGEATALSEEELAEIRRLLWDAGAPEDDRRRWLVLFMRHYHPTCVCYYVGAVQGALLFVSSRGNTHFLWECCASNALGGIL